MKHIIFSIFILLLPFAVAAQTACYSFDKGIVRDQVTGEVGYTAHCQIAPDRFGRDSGAIAVKCDYLGAITVGKGAQLKPANGTIMIWVKIPAECRHGLAYFDPIVFLTIPKVSLNTSDIPSYALYYNLSTETLDGGFGAQATGPCIISGVRPTYLNTWYHLALTFSDTEAKIYVNGILKNTTAKQPTQYDPLIYTYIGYRPESQNFAELVVDEFRVYDRVLTQQEIAAIYTAPSGATCSIVGTENATNNNDFVKVFPNPTTGALTLTHTSGTVLKTYTIADISGKIIAQNASIPSDNTLHLDLPNGVYFLLINDANGLITRHKVVLLH
jgi:hypothetical protein